MKKIFVTITIAVLGLSSSAENLIDPKIISAFEKEFSFAKNSKWEIKQELAQVSFLLNDQAVTAWYNSDAELVTIARNILYSQLPISVIRSLEKDYDDAALFGIMEVTHNNETYYQMAVQRENKTVLIKAS